MASINVPYGGSGIASVAPSEAKLVRHAREAYELLHVAFVVAPLVAGFDKSFHVLTNWDEYLSSRVARLSLEQDTRAKRDQRKTATTSKAA